MVQAVIAIAAAMTRWMVTSLATTFITVSRIFFITKIHNIVD